MRRMVLARGGVLAVLAATMGGLAGAQALAGGNGNGPPPHEHDECIYTAHGSQAAAERNARGGGGSGGSGTGKKTTCAKTFAHWNQTTLSIYVDSSSAPSTVDATTFEAYVHTGFAEWSCHSGLGDSVTLVYVDSAAGANITVGWGDLGTTGILGQTGTTYFVGTISHSSITMNNNESGGFTWDLGPSPDAGCQTETGNGSTNQSDYDLLSVLTHEIGHSLGVSHPDARCQSSDVCYPQTMYSCTASEEYMRRALNAGDVSAITSLYGN